MSNAVGHGTFPESVALRAAPPPAEGRGANPPAAAPVAAGEGVGYPYGPQQALDALAPLNSATFEQLRDILARVEPPIEWLNDPNSPQYQQVFIGLDRRIPPPIPGLPVNVPFWHNKMTAEFYLAMRLPPRGARRRKTRKPKRKHFRKRTSRRH